MRVSLEVFLWLVFTLMFASLAYRHWRLSGLSIEPTRLFGADALAEIRAFNQSETPNGLVKFIEKFNPIYRDLNKELVKGYLVAAGTAFLSFLVALFQHT